MKKALANTRVSVKLRKSEYREEWYLYVEAYPVFQADKPTPQRVREYLNRTITTPIWDKSRNARTDKDGKTTYKPKRDLNGIIQCKSQLDQESCIYADKVRSLRQKEYDNASLYSETDAEQAEQLERSRYNFIEYFDHVQRTRHAHSSDSIIANWNRVYELLKIFSKGNTIPFLQIDLKFVESFRQFILNAPQGGTKNGTLSQNTASTYFSIFKAALKQAFIDGYLTVDISAKVKGIQGKESRREYLTVEELNRLAQTPCDPLLKRASLFSALTGLRHCDIQKLKWSEVEEFNGGYRLNFTQQKTKGVEYMPISEQAYQLCGERKDGEKLVFAGLPDPSWINRPIKKWVAEAGLKAHGYGIHLQEDDKGNVRGYSILSGNPSYKSSILGKGRHLMPSKIEATWARLHEERKSSLIPNTEQKIRPATVSTEMPQTNRPALVIKHYDISTDEYHHYHVAIPEEADEIICKECSVPDDNPLATIEDVQKTALLLFAEYLDGATSMAASSGGGGSDMSGWGKDKDEDEREWARRCAQMANHLCKRRRGLHR